MFDRVSFRLSSRLKHADLQVVTNLRSRPRMGCAFKCYIPGSLYNPTTIRCGRPLASGWGILMTPFDRCRSIDLEIYSGLLVY